MDDLFVELCRSGKLGPLAVGMTAPEVEALLGEPQDIKWVHGASNWQRYRYTDLFLMLMCPEGDERWKRNLRLSGIDIHFAYKESLTLPAPIARHAILSVAEVPMEEAHRLLASQGIDMTYEVHDDDDGDGDTEMSTLERHGLGAASVIIYGFDGLVSSIHVEWLGGRLERFLASD